MQRSRHCSRCLRLLRSMHSRRPRRLLHLLHPLPPPQPLPQHLLPQRRSRRATTQTGQCPQVVTKCLSLLWKMKRMKTTMTSRCHLNILNPLSLPLLSQSQRPRHRHQRVSLHPRRARRSPRLLHGGAYCRISSSKR